MSIKHSEKKVIIKLSFGYILFCLFLICFLFCLHYVKFLFCLHHVKQKC